MRENIRRTLFSILKIGIALAIIFFILWKKVNLRDIARYLKDMNKAGLLVCWLLYGALFFLSARRWMVLVRAQAIAARYASLLRYYFTGLFFNNIMLGSMGGDLVKAYCLARGAPAPGESSLMSVVSDRIVGFISFFIIGMAGVAVNYGNPRLRTISALFAALFLLMGAGLCALFRKALLKKLPFAKRLMDKLPFAHNVRRLYDSLYSYRRHKGAAAAALMISLAMQLLTIAVVYLLARGLGMAEIRYSQLMLLMPVIGTVFALPITPSGWGTGELAFCSLFGAIGISESRALGLDFVMRAIVVSWSLVGGVLYVLPAGEKRC